MSYSDSLSTIALFLSALSFLFAAFVGIRQLYWARPIVSIDGTQAIGGSSDTPGQRRVFYTLEVLNRGAESTTILDAYWQVDNGSGVELRFKSSKDSFEGLFRSDDEGPEPRFPFTLDQYGHREWQFDFSLDGFRGLHRYRRERPVVEYTSRKKRTVHYGVWRDSQIGLWARDQNWN